jgi:hypothetical protein
MFDGRSSAPRPLSLSRIHAMLTSPLLHQCLLTSLHCHAPVRAVVKDPNWPSAMQEESAALIKCSTEFILRPPRANLIGRT